MSFCPPFPHHNLQTVNLKAFAKKGVNALSLATPDPVFLAVGHKARDGRFEPSERGPTWCAVEVRDEVGQHVDWALWRGLDTCTWEGRAFALGEPEIWNPVDAAVGLRVFKAPLDWLRAKRRGVVILRPEWALERLRHRRALVADNRKAAELLEIAMAKQLPEFRFVERRAAA